MNRLQEIETTQLKKDVPHFKSGDTLRVHCKIKEGDKERIQVFEGVVIRRHNGGIRSSFTVRKVSFGIGVERVFPLHAPFIDKIEVMTVGKVRRSKLYYLRELSGKKARIAAQDTRGLAEAVVTPVVAEEAAPKATASEPSEAAPTEETKSAKIESKPAEKSKETAPSKEEKSK